VFEEGELLHAAVIPIGSEHITADVAIGLRCPINLAERIKIEYGSAKSDKYTKKDEIDVTELAKEENISEENMVISQKYVAEIIEARVEEIFDKIDNELKKIDRSGMLPAGVFLIGGGAKLNDIVEVAKNRLRLPACIGSNKNVPLAIDKVSDVNFLTALGLTAWGNQLTSRKKGSKLNWPTSSSVNKITAKVKQWFNSLIP
jgi:cell division protein FtsA